MSQTVYDRINMQDKKKKKKKKKKETVSLKDKFPFFVGKTDYLKH